MSEDQMQEIPIFARIGNEIYELRDGATFIPEQAYISYADASRALRKLRDALERVTIKHFESCNCVINDDMHESCDCGVDEARAALREAK